MTLIKGNNKNDLKKASFDELIKTFQKWSSFESL